MGVTKMNRRDVIKSVFFGGLAVFANPVAALTRKELPPALPELVYLPIVKMAVHENLIETIALIMCMGNCTNRKRIFGKPPGTVQLINYSWERLVDEKMEFRFEFRLEFRYSRVGFYFMVRNPKDNSLQKHKVYKDANLHSLLKLGRIVA